MLQMRLRQADVAALAQVEGPHALLPTPEVRARVGQALGAHHDVRHCGSVSQLAAAVGRQRASAVITELADGDGTDVRDAIGALHARLPQLRVVVLAARTPDADDLLAMGLQGVSGLLTPGTPDFGSRLRDALAHAEEQSAAACILRQLDSAVPPDVMPFVAHCAAEGARRLNVPQAAAAVGIPVRTLRSRLRQHELPSPQRFVRWCRVLHAAWQLQLSGKRVKSVASDLGYESEVAFRKQFTRLVGQPPGAVMADGGFLWLLDRFRRELRADAARSSSPEPFAR